MPSRPTCRPATARLELLLTPREVSTVLFDQVEKVYFAVLRPDGRCVAGACAA